jgi:hypothetical protein
MQVRLTGTSSSGDCWGIRRVPRGRGKFIHANELVQKGTSRHSQPSRIDVHWVWPTNLSSQNSLDQLALQERVFLEYI